MEVTVDRDKLASAFNIAAAVAPPRSPKEILQNVKIIASGSSVTLEATNMEIGIRVVIADGVDVVSPGEALLPVRRFGAIVRESSDDMLLIQTTDNHILVKGKQSKFTLPTANPDEFPSVKPFDSDKYHKITAGDFRTLIHRTMFATDTDSSRYALGGVLFEMDETSVIAVGTDGRRLARASCNAESISGHVTNGATTIVPKEALSVIERAIAAFPDDVRFVSRLNDVVVQFGGCTISARLIEGRYPAWRQVIPEREANHVELVAGILAATVRQAAIVTDSESRGVDVSIGEDELAVSASTAEIGESRVTIPASFSGEVVTLTLDHRYLMDFLKAIAADAVFDIDFATANTPIVLSTDDNYVYVIMPMARDR